MPSRHPILALLVGSCLWLVGCANEGLEPGPSYALSKELALTAQEAATLLAELTAREFDQFRSDEVTPLSRAERESSESYRIYYQSGNGGGFEALANVELARQRFLSAGSAPLLKPLASSPLGKIRERPLHRAIAPHGGSRFVIDARIKGIGHGHCRVDLRCTGSVLGTSKDRSQRWIDTLQLCAGIRSAILDLHRGERNRSQSRLERALQRHRLTRGSIALDLEAIAFGLLARIQAEQGEWNAAETACSHAQLLAPWSAELHELRSRIAGRLGDRKELARSTWRAQVFKGPENIQIRTRLAKTDSWYGTCLQESHAALAQRDYISARSWAERAQNECPDQQEAPLLLARIEAHKGHFEAARNLLLSQIQRQGPEEELLLDLSQFEGQLGNEETAIRILLRYSKRFPGLLTRARLRSPQGAESILRYAQMLRSESLTSDSQLWLSEWKHIVENAKDRPLSKLIGLEGKNKSTKDRRAREPYHRNTGPGIHPSESWASPSR